MALVVLSVVEQRLDAVRAVLAGESRRYLRCLRRAKLHAGGTPARSTSSATRCSADGIAAISPRRGTAC
jgi:hypothetical protein